MIDERVNDHLQRLNRYLIELGELSKIIEEEFVKDNIKVAATERLFQLSIESCLNIANRILALEQFKQAVKAPESYADIFRELGKINIVDNEFVNSLVSMTKFRNRLVHLYWKVEPKELYKYLKSNLDDFSKFIKAIKDYYNKD